MSKERALFGAVTQAAKGSSLRGAEWAPLIGA